jgi:XTP/dITP diphosphohydrolase
VRARLASGNPHKLEEFREILPGWELELLGAELPPEDGATYLDNARGKARFGASVRPGEWVLGDDSGIEVDALGGAPGVKTARWAEGRHVEKLLAALDGETGRRARYVCELVAVDPAGAEHRGTGTLEGAIAREARGQEGFGFDPVFVPAGETRTVAELGDDWKREHSHRARAARALLDAIGKPRSAQASPAPSGSTKSS